MATTKKPTKAKTNTAKSKKPAAKKPVSKVAATKAKKVPAKSAKVSKVVKPTKAPGKVKQAKKALSSAEVLRRLNIVSVVVHVVGAAAALLLMSKATVQIFTGLVARDELASTATTVFVPAIHHLYDIELRYALAGVLLLGAVVPLINVLKADRYASAVKAKTNPLRWVGIGIVGAAMLGVVAALAGVQDFMTLKLVGGFIVVTAMLGWLAERQNADSKATPDRTAFVISLFSGAMPWLIIVAFAFGTPLWGMIRYPWYVYALGASVFVSSTAYALNGYNYVRRFRNWNNYELVERNYVVIDLLGRLSFAAILIIGLSK